jgi:predicted Zn finger-like uncharacterized protein
MRLICPNCTAQYEVDASMIPDEGRDVQCSNCGHTWYELAPAKETLVEQVDPAPQVDPEPWESPEAEPVAEAAPEPEPEPEFEPEPEYVPEPEPEEEPEPEFEPEPEEEPEYQPEPEPEVVAKESEPDEDSAVWTAEPESDWERDEAPEPVATSAPEEKDDDEDDDQDDSWDWPETRLVSPAEAAGVPHGKPANLRRPADVAAMDLLREEAEREISRRKSSTPSTLEVQTDFTLAAPEEEETPSRALKARMARLDTRDAIDEAESEYVEPRRELLPDMDEINSTLGPTAGESTRHARTPEQEIEHRKGFRLGFVASVGIAALMVISYVWAPTIASVVPGTENALIGYVDTANAARDALDALFGGGA